MSKARLDVIVAHYNGSKYIGQQIDSILANQIPQEIDLHILIVDDGSKPEQFELLQKSFANNAKVAIHKNERNLGVIRTFENGIKLSKGDYIMLCDQDDVWLPNKIEASWNALRKLDISSPALVFTNLRPVNQSLETISDRMLKIDFNQDEQKNALLFQNVVAGCTTIFNRKLKEFILPFPEGIPMHDHWITACAAFAGNIDYVSEPTILYRQHSANAVGTPKRSLLHRLKTPFKTFQLLDQSLTVKAKQAAELSTRLAETHHAQDPNIVKIEKAFKKRGPCHLLYLIRSKTFRANPITLTILSVAYLLSGFFKSQPASR